MYSSESLDLPKFCSGMKFLRCSTIFLISLSYFGEGCKISTQPNWQTISQKRELQTSVRWEAKFLPFCNSPGSFERVFPQLLQDGWSTSVIEKDHEADAIGEVLMFQHTSNALRRLNLVLWNMLQSQMFNSYDEKCCFPLSVDLLIYFSISSNLLTI